MPVLVSHGGSASSPDHEDGPRLACLAGLEVMAQGQSALQAVIAATTLLEDDERFNAGTGSNLRLDSTTIQMDAACMDSDGAFGAVAAIERVKNPILVAERVMNTPHVLLAGDGATVFARQCGFADHDPTTVGAKDRLRQILSVRDPLGEWPREKLQQVWNFETPLRQVLGSDTVGAIAFDGQSFAAALSSGGTTTVLRGRVGDVPLPGCGLYCGPAGTVATTGDGEYIVRALLAYRAYAELERGQTPEEVVAWTLRQLDADADVGVIVANQNQFSGGARHGMAWHGQCLERAT